jgi:hypothetical protein
MFIYKRYSTLDWTHIVIHHSLTKDGDTVSWGAIDKYHTEHYKWDEIGYNFGLERVSGIYRLFMGRTLAKQGAHCPPMNRKGIGICVVGNYDKESVLSIQYWWLAILCRDLMKSFDIPIDNIKRHSDYSSKSCPGKFFDMEELKKKIVGCKC